MEQEDRTSECDTGGNSEQMVSDTWAHEQDTLGTINANDVGLKKSFTFFDPLFYFCHCHFSNYACFFVNKETDNQGHGTPNEKDAIPTDENDSRPTERSVASPLHAEVHGNDSSIPAANIEHHVSMQIQPSIFHFFLKLQSI